jgi:Mn-dependent DtxR family transcriptional regulator
MTHDRSGVDTLALTQEFLAMMLGVHRPTVSLTAGVLQSAGLIRYRRGRVQIVDRAGLEEACCECYSAVQLELERLLILALRVNSVPR